MVDLRGGQDYSLSTQLKRLEYELEVILLSKEKHLLKRHELLTEAQNVDVNIAELEEKEDMKVKQINWIKGKIKNG